MSHEIRTPMNAILGITEIQLQNETRDQNIKEAFEKIYVSGNLLLGIINDILDLSKIEAGKLELVVENYETASLISDTVQLNIIRIGSKPIEFELSIDENLLSVLSGDELRIKQILNNLLTNAFKYTEAGRVILSVTTEPGTTDSDVTLVLCVSDTGRGMNQEQLEKLFDKFIRFDQDINRTVEGAGLGLSITQNLVELMNGKITVESAPEKGSIFKVYLPQGKVGSSVLGAELANNLRRLRASSRTQIKRRLITHEPMPYGSVLIVDDVETNIYVARGLLTPYGLKIDSVNSGFEAIEKIESGNMYDIVFMDHMMPKMDGIEATKIMRGMGYDNPIVALTANAVAGQADIFLSNGFDGFIAKPIDIRQLNAVLRKFIRDKQSPEVIEAALQEVSQKNETFSVKKLGLPASTRITEAFVRDAVKTIGVLDVLNEKQGPYNEEDKLSYDTNIHGMKSALAHIGKTELSAIAFNLEMSIRDMDDETIRYETSVFADSLRTVVEELAQKNESKINETVDEHQSYLHEKLLVIQAACFEYNEKVIDDAVTQLRKMSWTQSTHKLLETIGKHLLHSDFGEIIIAVNKYLEL
jgi:CheY-like chemotaxis protein/two-component sensor histidine kinase/HPt (histidine-containing phosphotransfer) domain-containing protein